MVFGTCLRNLFTSRGGLGRQEAQQFQGIVEGRSRKALRGLLVHIGPRSKADGSEHTQGVKAPARSCGSPTVPATGKCRGATGMALPSVASAGPKKALRWVEHRATLIHRVNDHQGAPSICASHEARVRPARIARGQHRGRCDCLGANSYTATEDYLARVPDQIDTHRAAGLTGKTECANRDVRGG